MTIDRANLNVPNRPGFTFEGLIRNSRLPHGTSPNTSHRPRLAQYISTSPAPEDNAAARAWRTESQLHRRAPAGDPFPGDPRGWERRHGTTAALTPLDRKLLGLDTWAPPRPRTPAAAAPCGWTTPAAGAAQPLVSRARVARRGDRGLRGQPVRQPLVTDRRRARDNLQRA